MPHPLLIFSQLDYLIKVVDSNSNIKWQTADQDQLASEANLPGSTQFAIAENIQVQQD